MKGFMRIPIAVVGNWEGFLAFMRVLNINALAISNKAVALGIFMYYHVQLMADVEGLVFADVIYLADCNFVSLEITPEFMESRIRPLSQFIKE